MRLSFVGFEVITVEVRVVVASINTFLDYAAAVGVPTGAERPPLTAEPEPVPAALLAAGARQAAPRAGWPCADRTCPNVRGVMAGEG